MHLTRRMRLIWHKLWLIPLVGATADVVASEAAKLGGVTVPVPWLFSAIGVVGMLGAAVVRAYSVPLIPEGLETPDEALTRRSRILGERLGATPVRVFVCDLPKLRGKVDTFLDGHDLFVSERVAEMPEAERDFVLARALAWRCPEGRRQRRLLLQLFAPLVLSSAFFFASGFSLGRFLAFGLMGAGLFLLLSSMMSLLRGEYSFLTDGGGPNVIALQATADLPGAIEALAILASEPQAGHFAKESVELKVWWNSKGQKAVEASEWYQRELAKTSEINQISSRAISGDSSIKLPISETT